MSDKIFGIISTTKVWYRFLQIFKRNLVSGKRNLYVWSANQKSTTQALGPIPKIIEEYIYRGNHLIIIRVDDAKGKRGELI